VRAPTPSAAAELAVPVRIELVARVESLARRSLACWQRGQEARRSELRAAMRALPTAEELLALPRQRLDQASTRLPRALTANTQIHHARFARVAGRLGPQVLRGRVSRCTELVIALSERGKRAETVARLRRRERLANATARLAAGLRANADAHRGRIGAQCERVASLCARARRALDSSLRQRAASVERCGQLLDALSHRGVLARGFALVRDGAGRPLRQASTVSAGMQLDIEFSDGRVPALAQGSSAAGEKPRSVPATEGTVSPAKPRGRRGSDDSNQGSLFGA